MSRASGHRSAPRPRRRRRHPRRPCPLRRAGLPGRLPRACGQAARRPGVCTLLSLVKQGPLFSPAAGGFRSGQAVPSPLRRSARRTLLVQSATLQVFRTAVRSSCHASIRNRSGRAYSLIHRVDVAGRRKTPLGFHSWLTVLQCITAKAVAASYRSAFPFHFRNLSVLRVASVSLPRDRQPFSMPSGPRR